MAKETTSRNATYLSINKDGYLYQKSNTPKEGWDEITLDSGAKTYHKTYTSTDDGFIDFLSIDKRDFATGEVEIVSISVKSGEETDKISFQLFKNNGGLSDYAKGLALVLPNLEYARQLNVSPSRKRNDKGYLNRFLFINYVDGNEPKYPEFAHKFKTKNNQEGDIPSAEKESKMGKDTWNFEKQDEFLYKVLLDEIARFKQFKESSKSDTPQVEVTTSVKKEKVVAASTEEEDDLPF